MSISILLETRDNVGVSTDNPCVWGPHSRQWCPERVFSQMRSKHQELLRSTKLRHHIATLSQILNFKDNELDILTNFLGHDIRTHREYYRLPEESLQVSKMYTIVYPWYLPTFIAEFLGLMDEDASTFQLLDFRKHVKEEVAVDVKKLIPKRELFSTKLNMFVVCFFQFEKWYWREIEK